MTSLYEGLARHPLAGQYKPPARPTRHHRSRPAKYEPDYAAIWRIVDGAVRDAFANHPDYLTAKGTRSAQISIVKRVTGAVHSQVVKATRGHTSTTVADTEATLRTGRFLTWLRYQAMSLRGMHVSRTNSRERISV